MINLSEGITTFLGGIYHVGGNLAWSQVPGWRVNIPPTPTHQALKIKRYMFHR